jgi:3-hydroxyisobutyrate dehydrogenase-like beta-hydroxyacid dehydrogenase
VVNGLLATQLAVAGELLDILRRFDVDLAAAAELITSLPVTAPALARSLPRILAGDTAPAYPLDLAAKDLRYLRAAAGRTHVLTAVGDTLDRAARNDGTRDIVALAMPAATTKTGP